jgi:hypothetical protein
MEPIGIEDRPKKVGSVWKRKPMGEELEFCKLNE